MLEMNPAVQRKLIVGVAVVATLLVLGGGVALFAMQSASDAVTLSDGNEVHLGETRADLEKSLGSDAVKLKAEVYRYPSSAKPVEALIYMQKDKVSGVMVSRGPANKLKQSGISLGESVVNLSKKYGKSLVAVNTASDQVKQDGYKVEGGKSTTYYIIATCPAGKSTNVTAMAVVMKGDESELTSLSRARNCTPPAKASTLPAAATAPAKK